MPIKQEIRVELGSRGYSVVIGSGFLEDLASLLKQAGISEGHLVLVTDTMVGRLYVKKVRSHLLNNGYKVDSVTIKPGEGQKSLGTAARVYSDLLKKGTSRTSTVIALGGGVVGDLAGFVAATYHRGINLIHIPTTLLAQVDSSIGGKTGVNHPLGKNMIGAFYQPRLVVSDAELLQSLPFREIVCGAGEIVKYAVILDEPFFSFLENSLEDLLALDRETILHVVSRCAELKGTLVSRDERESGDRIILNCGHTVGHALEAAGRYRLLKHGEAVLLGLAAEGYIARQLGLLSSDGQKRLVDLIARIPLTARLSSLRLPLVLSLLSRDKKFRNGKNRFVLPVRIGGVTVVEDVSLPLIREALKYVTSLHFKVSR